MAGRRLLASGHEVVVLGPERVRSAFAADGIPLEVHADADVVARFSEVAPTVAPDLAVVDFMMPGVLSAAEALGIRGAALVHTLPRPEVVGAFTPLDALNALRAELGVPAVRHPNEVLSRADRVLIALPDVLVRGSVPPGYERARYLGALYEEPGPDAGWTPTSPDRPLVVVSLGTTPMDEEPVLQRVLDGLGSLTDVAVLATVADHVDRSALRVPPNAELTPLLRHSAVLPHATVVVTHAGLGTVTASLAFGCPMVCLPLGRDQFNNARLVEELGAGVELDREADPAEIARAVAELLAPDAPQRVAARRLKEQIERESPPERVVEALATG